MLKIQHRWSPAIGNSPNNVERLPKNVENFNIVGVSLFSTGNLLALDFNISTNAICRSTSVVVAVSVVTVAFIAGVFAFVAAFVFVYVEISTLLESLFAGKSSQKAH